MSVIPDPIDSLAFGGAKEIEYGIIFADGRFRAWHDYRPHEELPMFHDLNKEAAHGHSAI